MFRPEAPSPSTHTSHSRHRYELVEKKIIQVEFGAEQSIDDEGGHDFEGIRSVLRYFEGITRSFRTISGRRSLDNK